MKRNSVEYYGHIYRLRSESLKGIAKDFGTSCVSLYLDIYKLFDNGSSSVSGSLKNTCTIPVPRIGPFVNFYIEVVENSDYIKVPLIIVELRSQPLELWVFTIDVSESRISLFKKCMVENRQVNSDCDLHILAGPTFAWITTESNLHFKTLLGSECVNTEIGEVIHRVLYVKCNYNSFSDHFSFLIVAKTKDDIISFVLCVDPTNGKFTKPVNISVDCFIPESYTEIVSSIYVDLHRSLEEKIICRGDSCHPFPFAFEQNYTCACTIDKRFFVFVNGTARYTCPVPLARITTISCLKQFQEYQVSFLLLSNSGLALVQKIQNECSVQVSKVWESVSDVYFGDFHHSGCPVLLLLKDSFFPKVITNFIVADVTGRGGGGAQKGIQGLQESGELINTMVRAFDKRVSAGQFALNRAEENFQDKQRVLDSAVRTLEGYTRTGTLTATYQDVSLVEVALGFQRGPPCNFEPGGGADAEPLCLKVLSQWQTTYRDHWILGWTLKNDSLKTVQDLSGLVFDCEQSLEVRQRVFLHPGGPYVSQPTLEEGSQSGRCVGSKQLVSLLLALDIPVSSRDTTHINALIFYDVLQEGDSFAQQLSFGLTWNTSDMDCHWQNKFSSLSVVQQVMCHRVLQTGTCLEVKGSSSLLVGPTPEVLAKAGLRAPSLLQPATRGGSNTFIFAQSESPLSAINFTWDAEEENNRAQVNIHCRTVKQLLLFVHWLYDFLAKEASVLPSADPDVTPLCHQMWQAMAQELDKSVSVFRKRSSTALKRPAPGEHPQKSWTMAEYLAFRKTLTICETDTDNILRGLFNK